MKIYSIAVSIIAALAIVLAGYFFWQVSAVKTESGQIKDNLAQSQLQLQQANQELGKLRELVDTGLTGAKADASILKDSLESFLVAGDLKVAALGVSEAEAISAKIQNVPEKMDKISYEKGWSDFRSSKKISDVLAFARSLTNSIQNKLENIH